MTTLELVVAVASLITAIAAIVGLYLTRKEMNENREGGGERNKHLAEVVANLAESVGVQKNHADALSTRLDALVSGSGERNQQLSAVVLNVAEIVAIQKKQIEALATRLDALVSEQQRRTAIAERQRFSEEQQQKVNLVVAGVRALGWMYDRGWFE